MDKLKGLLLPLALVFGAIAVFETGARYGADNFRAQAIALEMQNPLNVYVASKSKIDPSFKAQLEMSIDRQIAAGSVHRQVWYLSKESKAVLNKALTYALSVRGNATLARFEATTSAESKIPQADLDRIIAAIKDAKTDLIDNAPSVADQDAAADHTADK
ncbi:MAG: hypothetical protein ACPGJU_03435 [Coraliomargarita sp.]